MTAPPELAWIEGQIVPAREAKVPLNDRGLMFAEAAYEVCVGRGGRVFAWPEHRRRLARTLDGIQMPEAEAALARTEKAVSELVAAFGPGTFLLYLEVTGGVAPRLHVLPRDPSPAVYATIRPHERGNLAREQERGLVAIVTPDVRWRGATWKTTQLLPNVLAKKLARAAGADDVVFVADDGVVLEGAATNVFWVGDGKVRTAPLTRNILPGVTREVLRTKLSVAFEEVEADLATVKRASEVFMAGTTRDVTAVVKLDGQLIGDGRPGPVVRDLGRKLAELFDRECPA